NHLESRMKIIERYPEVDLLHGGVEIIGEEYVPDKYNDGRKIHLSECAIGATFFIRKKVFNLLGGFKKLPIGTDADFFERSKEAGLKILKTGLPTYIYNRSHRNSITHNDWQEMQNQAIYGLDNLSSQVYRLTSYYDTGFPNNAYITSSRELMKCST